MVDAPRVVALGGRAASLAVWSGIATVLALSAASQVANRLWPDAAAVTFAAEVLHVDEEQSVPTLVSVLLLLACAAVLAAVAVEAQRQHRAGSRRWAVLSGLFVGLALDEHLSLHERLIDPVRDGLGTGGLFYFAWTIPALVLVAALAVLFAPFVLRLPPDVRLGFIAAAALYLGGAIGAEMVAGWQIDRGEEPSRGLVTIEEALELSGAALLLGAARRYLRDHLGGFELTLRVAR